MASKLAQALRNGVPPHKIIDIRGMKVAVVVVSADIMRKCEEDTEQYANDNPSRVNERVKNQHFDTLLAYHCMRDPDNLNNYIADNVDEVYQILDNEDISRVMNAYGELMINKAPKIELLTEDQLEDIKKYLEVTKLKDLSTVLLVHLMNFHQAMPSDQ